jgi:tellurite resistance protein TerC
MTETILPVITIVITLIFLEGILSIDNAAVIAAMANKLPRDRTAPKPVAWLGIQRSAALKAGLFGAFFGRFSMLAVAGFIIKYPMIHTIGAIYLLQLVVNHFFDFSILKWLVSPITSLFGRTAPVDRQFKERNSFWGVVISVELADLAFSIDNVVAAVALSPKLWIVTLGVFLGIVTMRFAAAIFQRLIDKVPTLEHAAYLLIAAIAGELLLEQYAEVNLSEVQTFLISASIIVLTVLYHFTFVARRPKPAYVRPEETILDELADAERLLEGVPLDAERLPEAEPLFVSGQSAYVLPEVALLDELVDAEHLLEEEALLASSK